MPPERTYTPRPAPRLDPVKPFMDSILKSDLQAPRKQRHTAQRIYNRLREELPQHAIARSTVAEYIVKRKGELGLCHRETFVPQSYQWGVEGQVDWYEAFVDLTGERTKVYVFCMRSMASGAAFHHAYLRPTQQAFLEAHELAFGYFGGVFQRLRYDNLKSAVRKILRGQRREETVRFIAFRSHWRVPGRLFTPRGGERKRGGGGGRGEIFGQTFLAVPEREEM